MVELISVFGDDEMVVNTARVSFKKIASDYTPEQNEKLIHYLAKHEHTSPFRHGFFRYRIECPVYVERQLFKHRAGVEVNSVSGRYVDFSDSYTSINEWRSQSKNSKQGSDLPLDVGKQLLCSAMEQQVIDFCSKTYKSLCELGVSKEQARSILPLNLNTQFIMTISFQALVHMIKLRLDGHAQYETSAVVYDMAKLALEDGSFKTSFSAFDVYNLVSEFEQKRLKNY
jgi:thymidylate synthase (FAD)